MTNDRLTPILVEVLDEIEEEREFLYNHGLLTEEHDYLLDYERQEVLSLIDEGLQKRTNSTYNKKSSNERKREDKLNRELRTKLQELQNTRKTRIIPYDRKKSYTASEQKMLSNSKNSGRKRRTERTKGQTQRGASSNLSPKSLLRPEDILSLKDSLSRLRKAVRWGVGEMTKELDTFDKKIGNRPRARSRSGTL